MYRYYKGHSKKGVWKSISVQHEAARLESDEVAFCTVLTVSEKVGPGESVSEAVTYQGPYYIDIDSETISKAIKAAKKIIAKLEANGIPTDAMRMWASGKKGFHLTIDEKFFSSGEPVLRLPVVYKQMSLVMGFLDMDEVDDSVYSAGKGRMWRIEGKEREDNQKYKVPIRPEELEDMNEEMYLELVSKPRTVEIPNFDSKITFLESLFRLSVGRVDHMEKPRGVFIDPNLKKVLGEDLPPCVQNLIGFENIKPLKGFNEISVQVAKGIAAFQPEKAKELIERFSSNSKGNTYNTPAKRKAHCATAFRIASKNGGYDWACPSILAVLESEPCMECPIAFIRFEDEGSLDDDSEPETIPVKEAETISLKPPAPLLAYEAEPLPATAPMTDEQVIQAVTEAHAEEAPAPKRVKKEKVKDPADTPLGYNTEGLMEVDEGYEFLGGDGKRRRISNFILRITKVFIQFVPNLSRDVRIGVEANVVVSGKVVGAAYIEDSNWGSKSGLISCLAGLGNAGFYGKDDDVQKMKIALMADIEERAVHIRETHSWGVHRQQIGEQWVFTYVEPGWSIDQFGVENRYALRGKLTAHPKLKIAQSLGQNDEALAEVFKSMFKVNHSHRVAQVLGWNMACYLVQHIFTFRNEFPLLSLHGEPGSGKTSTASLFAALHGLDYRLESSPINLPSATPFVTWSFVAGSTSGPRLLEEFNKARMQRHWDAYVENFKACWNHHSVNRGTIKGDRLHGGSQIGAHVVDIPLTGPIVLCSEQEITVPALLERMIQVRFSKKDKEHQAFESAFEFAAERLGKMVPFAKACYLEVIQLTPAEVKQWLSDASKHVPKEITARPRHSYQVVLAGLAFLERIIKKYEIPCHLEFSKLRAEFVDWLTINRKQIATVKSTSEVDAIIGAWSTMAAMSVSDGTEWLTKGRHYMRTGNRLYVDPLVAHAQYLRYCSLQREIKTIDRIAEFYELIKGETYLISMNERIDGFAKGRPVILMDCDKLQAKGINIDGFEESSLD